MASLTATFGEIDEPHAHTGRGPRGTRVAVIGAGIGGVCAAIDMAKAGAAVTVFEKAPRAGGKIRTLNVAGRDLDAGPTVLTMRWVFESIFEDSGYALDEAVTATPVPVLARHAWQDGSRLDLFADRQRSIEAIAEFAGPSEAAAFARFADKSARLYASLEPGFMTADKPGPLALAARMLRVDPASLVLTNPMATLWQSLSSQFQDPRLRQLFGRYATYSGASPFEASSTLMLIAHVEEAGVWTLDGGMAALAAALERLAGKLGVTFRYDTTVSGIAVESGRATGVELADGERHAADAVVANSDCSAIADGLFGTAAARAVPRTGPHDRSLSAVATALVGEVRGFPLTRHNVFFSRDYRAEFDAIFKNAQLPKDPTVYICAQDRDGTAGAVSPAVEHVERALLLVNAPANGDRHTYTETEIEACWENTLAVLKRCGLDFAQAPVRKTTTPTHFASLFPATGGALYGRSSHGWAAAFRRPGARTAIPRLYLAGGSVHPGAGVPMAALSGRRAAASLLADLASTRRFHPVATSGGTSTR